MSLLAKVKNVPNLCSIALDFDGEILPYNITSNKSFYDSVELATNWIYNNFGRGSVQFRERSLDSRAGTKYQQQLTFRFPNLDVNTSKRTAVFSAVKNIKLTYSNGLELIIGRNDHIQNRRPSVSTNNNGKFLTVEFTTESITPVGVLNSDTNLLGFPEILPVNFGGNE